MSKNKKYLEIKRMIKLIDISFDSEIPLYPLLHTHTGRSLTTLHSALIPQVSDLHGDSKLQKKNNEMNS